MSDAKILVPRRDAARLMGMSLSSFERHCQPQLRLVRRGRLVLVPVRELERWAAANAAHTLGADKWQ